MPLRPFRRQKEAAAPAADQPPDELAVSYIALREKALTAFRSLVLQSEESLVGEFTRGGAGMEEAAMQAIIKGVLEEFLARYAAEQITELSEQQLHATRTQLRAQAATYELKLETSRTAASMREAQKAVDLEAAMHRKLEEQLAAQAEGGLSALENANRRTEELATELNALKLKSSGMEDALTMTKELLKKSEAKATELEQLLADAQDSFARERMATATMSDDLDRSQKLLDKALAELDIRTKANATLEEKIAEVLEDAARSRKEGEEARSELGKAMDRLGFVMEENMTLTEQIQRLADEASQVEQVRGERDRANEKARMAQAALEKLDGEKRALNASLEEAAAKFGALQAELDAARRDAGGGAEMLQRERERCAELERVARAREVELNAAADKYAALQKQLEAVMAASEKLREESAMAGQVHASLERTSKLLDAAFQRMQLPPPPSQESGSSGSSGGGSGGGAEAKAKALLEYLERVMQKLEHTVVELHKTGRPQQQRGAAEPMDVKIQAVIGAWAASRGENEDLLARAEGLEEDVKRLEQEMLSMGDSAGAVSKQVAHWKNEAAKLDADIGRNVDKITSVVGAAQQSVGGGRGAPSLLTRHVEKALGRLAKLGEQLKEMEGELAKGAAAIEELSNKLMKAEGQGQSKMMGVREEAKKERAALVNSALESMRHLRSHLISALSGLREPNGGLAGSGVRSDLDADPMDQARMVWESATVVRVEMPPTSNTNHTSPRPDSPVTVAAAVGQAAPSLKMAPLKRMPGRSPRIVRGLSYEPHFAVPPRGRVQPTGSHPWLVPRPPARPGTSAAATTIGGDSRSALLTGGVPQRLIAEKRLTPRPTTSPRQLPAMEDKTAPKSLGYQAGTMGW